HAADRLPLPVRRDAPSRSRGAPDIPAAGPGAGEAWSRPRIKMRSILQSIAVPTDIDRARAADRRRPAAARSPRPAPVRRPSGGRRRCATALVVATCTSCAGCALPPPRDVHAPARVERIWDPAAVADGRGRVYAAALSRDSTGTPCFVFARSGDGGDDWRRRAPAPFGRARGARRRVRLAAAAPSDVYALWEDTRNG